MQHCWTYIECVLAHLLIEVMLHLSHAAHRTEPNLMQQTLDLRQIAMMLDLR